MKLHYLHFVRFDFFSFSAVSKQCAIVLAGLRDKTEIARSKGQLLAL
jgi:hypothetical protein